MLGKKILDKACAKILKNLPKDVDFQRVSDAVSNRYLDASAEEILPEEILSASNEGSWTMVRAAVAAIGNKDPEAVMDLAEFLMQKERTYFVENHIRLLKDHGGSLRCVKNSERETTWTAMASMILINGECKEAEARSNSKWEAQETAAREVLEADPLYKYYHEFPRACQYFQTFGMGPSLTFCPSCGQRCSDLKSLLNHMENGDGNSDDEDDFTGYLDCADVKNGLDWDACGISHETGEFMWGNND